jgi:hypothetical protein
VLIDRVVGALTLNFESALKKSRRVAVLVDALKKETLSIPAASTGGSGGQS